MATFLIWALHSSYSYTGYFAAIVSVRAFIYTASAELMNREYDISRASCTMDPLPESSGLRSMHSGCLERHCVTFADLCVIKWQVGNARSRSDSDPPADPVPDQTMLPTVSLTESDIPGAFLNDGFK